MNEFEVCESTNADIPYNTSGVWPIGICCEGHPGTTSEDVKRQPICTGSDGSLFEVSESSIYVQDNCDAHCVFFMNN